MWSLMAFSMPGVLGSRSYFKKRFDKRKDPQSQNRLAARLKPFLLRRTKSQVAKDLPPRTEEEVYAKMEGIQSQLYKAELRRIQQALLGLDSDESVKKNSFAILQGLMRLRQICCHPGLVDPKYAKEDSAKMTALFYLLDQLREEGHKVLVFSQFVSMLEIIKTALDSVRKDPDRGELMYQILYETYFTPSKPRRREDIIDKLDSMGFPMSIASYHNYLNAAIHAIDRILWGYTARDCIEIIKQFLPD